MAREEVCYGEGKGGARLASRSLLREGELAFKLHRLTGLGMVLFLMLHIADMLVLLWSPALFDRLMLWWRHPLFRLAEIVLVGAVIFHAVNGVRLILLACRPALCRYQRWLFRAVVVATAAAFAPLAWLMLGAAMGR